MSADERSNVDLLYDIQGKINDTHNSTAIANLSTTLSRHALPAGATCRSHEAENNLEPSGAIDSLGDLALLHSPSSVIPVPVGSSVDLLGDEIIEAPAVAELSPQHSVCTDTSMGSKKCPPREVPDVLAQKPCSHKYDQQGGQSSVAAIAQQQQQKDTAEIYTNDHGPQQLQQWPQEQLSSLQVSANACEENQKQEQQQIAEIRKPSVMHSGQQAPSSAAMTPMVSFKAVQIERPSPCSSDGSLRGEAIGRTSGGDSQSLPSDTDRDREPGDGVPSGDVSNAPSGQGSDTDERIVDSDREVVEEEDAFGDFADFTSASHFLPGGGGGFGGAAYGAPQPQPPPSASSAAVARANAAGSSSASSPSAHRHGHLGGLGRPLHGMLVGPGGAYAHYGGAGMAASVSGAMSEHGSLAGEFSDISHQSPPPSVAPSRGGGGRKSVASIASVGSRAGGDDDLGDYNSVVGSSVWRAPSQMATSSYAAAAGADDDFGDFTSDITSTSDFAPSTQPPSAVAVSGPGSVHPDDDFGSFASHRSTADDDEDDFGNFNGAPAGVGAAAAAAGAGPSGIGVPIACGLGPGTSGLEGGSTASGSNAGVPGVAFSPRDAAAVVAPPGSHPYHSTQSVGPLLGGSAPAPEVAAASEAGLLQLAPAELRQAVVRALQPLLPIGTLAAGAYQLQDNQIVSTAWVQLRRHMHGNFLDAGCASVPTPQIGTLALPSEPCGLPDSGGAGRSGGASGLKVTRSLRWKGSDSERRLLSGLGLSEVAAQARMAEAAEGLWPAGRSRLDSTPAAGGGTRQMGHLASYGDALRRTRADSSTVSAGLHWDIECDSVSSGSSGVGNSRSRGLEQNGEEHGGGSTSGTTPRAAESLNGFQGGQQSFVEK